MGGTHSSPLFLFAPVCRWAAAKHEKLWRFNVCCSSVCIEWIKFQSNMQSAPKFQFYFTCIGIIILWDACVFCVSGGPGREFQLHEFTDWLAEWLSGRHSKPVYLSAQNVLLNIENCTITTRMPSMWTQLTQLTYSDKKYRSAEIYITNWIYSVPTHTNIYSTKFISFSRWLLLVASKSRNESLAHIVVNI